MGFSTWNAHCHPHESYAIWKSEQGWRGAVDQFTCFPAGEVDRERHIADSAGQLRKEKELTEPEGQLAWIPRIKYAA